MTLAAVLCCAMTTTVFTACGDDDDKPTTTLGQSGNNGGDTSTPAIPVYAYANFMFENTADMLKYLDIEIVYQVNDQDPQIFGPITETDVNEELKFGLKSAPQIPVTLTYYRRVKVKDQYKDTFASIEKFDFTNKIVFKWGLYDADRKLIPGNYIDNFNGTYGTVTGEKMLENMEKKYFDIVYTVTFDKDGNKTFSHKRPE